MTTNKPKEDLRIIKTEKALNSAMHVLLERNNFRKITVSDLCEQALISRATFYAHFSDKYGLLKYWLTNLTPDIFNSVTDTYDRLEITVNSFMHNNKTVIRNIVDGADSETLDILFDYMFNILDISIDKNINGKINPKYVVLSNFCAGGMVFYLLWQVNNKFPNEVPMMNIYFNNIIDKLLEWASIENQGVD